MSFFIRLTRLHPAVIAGVTYRNSCPEISSLPAFLFVGGLCGCLKVIFLLTRRQKIDSPEYERLEDTADDVTKDAVLTRFFNFTDIGLSVILMIWFVFGSIWLSQLEQPAPTSDLYHPNAWCDNVLFAFSVYVLISCYIFLGIIIILCTILVSLFVSLSL